jgi:predicted membrane metal-binding protein
MHHTMKILLMLSSVLVLAGVVAWVRLLTRGERPPRWLGLATSAACLLLSVSAIAFALTRGS